MAFFVISSMVLGLLHQLQIILAVASARIARAFNSSGATWAVALDISKAFDRVWHAGLFHKLKSYGISGGIFGLLFSVMTFWMESLHKNIQLMLEFLKTPLLVPHFSYYTLMTFLMILSVILLSMLMILLYSKCDQASDL